MTAVLLGITGLLNRLAMRLTLYGCWYKAMNPDEPDELWKCLLSAVSTYIDFVGLHQITFGLFKVPLRKMHGSSMNIHLNSLSSFLPFL